MNPTTLLVLVVIGMLCGIRSDMKALTARRSDRIWHRIYDGAEAIIYLFVGVMAAYQLLGLLEHL